MEGEQKPKNSEIFEKIEKEIETFFTEEKKKIDEFNADMEILRKEHITRLVRETLQKYPENLKE